MLFAVLLEIRKDLVDKTVVSLVGRNAQTVFFEMRKGHGGVVILAVVDLGRRELVADAFDKIDIGHARRLGAFGIHPILGVVLVASLVMQPRARYARLSAAGTEGRTVSPKETDAFKKLLGVVFREVVQKTAKGDTALEGVNEYESAMARDDAQMGKQLDHRTPFVAEATRQ